MDEQDLMNIVHDINDTIPETRVYTNRNMGVENFIVTIKGVTQELYSNPSDHENGGDMFAEAFDRMMDTGLYQMDVTIKLNRIPQ